MKVMHLLGSGRPGGVESFVLQLMRDTSPSDAHLSVCIVGDDGPISGQLREAGATVTVVGTNQGSASQAARFAGLIASGDYDIIHANSGGRLLRTISRISQAPLVNHLHGIEQTWLADVESRGDGLRRRVRTFCTGAEEVAVSSMWMHDLLTDASCPRPITILRYGVDLQRFSPAERARLEGDARRSIGAAGDEKVVGFVGRLTRQKGTDHLLALARELSDDASVVVAVVGDGPDREAMEREARESRLVNVRFTGETISAEKLMAAFDVLVMASEWEPFGIVALEANAMGIPVAAFDVGGIREAAPDNVSGLLVGHRDVGALAVAVRRLLSDGALRASLGQSGRRHVEAGFDSRASASAVLSHYRDLIDRSAASGERRKSSFS